MNPKTGKVELEPSKISYLIWDISFEGSNLCTPKGEGIQPSVYRFFGNGNHIGRAIGLYERVRYENLYPGIDLIYYLDGKEQMKYDFILKPGADISMIRIKYNGIEGLELSVDGGLVIKTLWENFAEQSPVSFHEVNGNQIPVAIKYRLYDNCIIGFEPVRPLDLTKSLIIDPLMLDWSTFFYGNARKKQFFSGAIHFTLLTGVDIDAEGYVYLTGSSETDFPTKTGLFDSATLGIIDIFYCKINPTCDSFIFFDYIGGDWGDYSFGLNINRKGEGVIFGVGNPPMTPGAFNPNSGPWFLTVFNSNGDSVLLSTYFSTDTYITDAVITDSGDVVLAGIAFSKQIPITSGAYQTNFGGGSSDGYVAKIQRDGKKLNFCTFIGGKERDDVFALALNKNEEIYLTGLTSSSDFPTIANSSFKSFKGGEDAFLLKLNETGSKLIFSNLVGGSDTDHFESICVNDNGDIFVAGHSNSTNFPTTPNAFQKKKNGNYDIVAMKFIPDGSSFRFSTYLGGNGDDKGLPYLYERQVQIAANVKDEAIVTGLTSSTDFPLTSDAIQKTNKAQTKNKSNLTISKLSFGGDKLLYSTYWGGSAHEFFWARKIKKINCVTHILMGGLTYSRDFPTTKNTLFANPPPDTLFGKGNYNIGFLSKFSDTLNIEKPSFGSKTKLRCNEFLEILDGLNQGANRRWNTNDSGRYLFVTKPGTYWVEATYGCDTLRDTIRIVQQFGPKKELGPDTILCNQTELILDAGNDTLNGTYLWGTSDSTLTYRVTKSGKYWVTVSTQNCGSETDTIQVTFLTTPKVSMPKDSLFCDSVITTIDAANDSNEVTYNWNTTDTTQTIVVKDTGVYMVIVANVCGSDSSQTKISKLKSPETFLLPMDTTFCGPFLLTLRIGTKHNEEVYNWNDLINQLGIGTTDSLKRAIGGTLEAIVTNSCGITKDTIVIKQLSKPKIKLDSLYDACENISLKLDINNPKNEETYLWSTTETTPVITTTKAGNYWAKAMNYCGEDLVNFKVVLYPKPSPNFTVADVCEGELVPFKNNSTGGKDFEWRFGDGTLSTDSVPNKTYAITQNSRTYFVTLLAKISSNCRDSISKPLNVNATSDGAFAHTSQGKTVFFTQTTTEPGESYKWFFGDGDSSAAINPSHTFKADSGTYNVCLNILNAANCQSQVCRSVHYSVGIDELETGFFRIYPNPTDGTVHLEFSNPVSNATVSVYNLLGEKVFEKTDLRESSVKLEIGHLSEGVYFIKVLEADRSAIEKIVLMK